MKNSRMSVPSLSLGLGLTFLLATAASAVQDIAVKTDQPSGNWTGAYFGTYFGVGNSNNVTQSQTIVTNSQQTSSSPGVSTITKSSSRGVGNINGNATGSIADLFVGYNYNPHYAHFIFGGQLEGTFFSDISMRTSGHLTFANSSVTITTVGGGSTSTSTYTTSKESTDDTDDLSSMFSLVVRGGYLIQPTWLVYLLAGGTEGNFVLPNTNDYSNGKRSTWELGYTLGAGLEHQFNQHWSLRGEYRFLHFNIHRTSSERDSFRQNAATSASGSSSQFTQSSNTDFNFNLAWLGVVYGF